MSSNTLALTQGTRVRTGGVTYEVTKDAKVPAGVVPVIPQSTRLLKVHCETCGYTCRITQRWITKAGTPDCPSGHGSMVVAVKPAEAIVAAPPAPSPVADVIRELEPFAEPSERDYEPYKPDTVDELFEADPEPIESRTALAALLADLQTEA